MASLTRGIFIVGAKRTPFGTFGGKLADKTCVDLQEVAAKAALTSANVNPELVDSVIIGNVLSCSSVDAPYISRHVSLRCGIPIPTPALTGIPHNCNLNFFPQIMEDLITSKPTMWLWIPVCCQWSSCKCSQ